MATFGWALIKCAAAPAELDPALGYQTLIESR